MEADGVVGLDGALGVGNGAFNEVLGDGQPHFVATVGGAPLQVIKQYVADQRNA